MRAACSDPSPTSSCTPSLQAASARACVCASLVGTSSRAAALWLFGTGRSESGSSKIWLFGPGSLGPGWNSETRRRFRTRSHSSCSMLRASSSWIMRGRRSRSRAKLSLSPSPSSPSFSTPSTSSSPCSGQLCCTKGFIPSNSANCQVVTSQKASINSSSGVFSLPNTVSLDVMSLLLTTLAGPAATAPNNAPPSDKPGSGSSCGCSLAASPRLQSLFGGAAISFGVEMNVRGAITCFSEGASVDVVTCSTELA
mmetsp:Transcript_25261/g.59948  ORF Transcript_25261/g.59948 Transcript_25261/m.59948 type:complete len:254 (+) Transcript_25261:432-1193(+)